MTIVSKGFAGTITDADWPFVSRFSGATYMVDGAGDFKVTIGSGDRRVNVAGGASMAAGVFAVSDAVEYVDLPSVSSGSRWDLIGLSRLWSSGETTVVRVAGSSAKTLPARPSTPGDEDVQPLALVRVLAGSATIQEIVDLRVWVADGGALAADDLVRSYMTRVGSIITVAGVSWLRQVSSTGSAEWVQLSGASPTFRLSSVTDASLSSTAHAFQIGPDSGSNLIADSNEIMARDAGSTSQLILNGNGGNVVVGGPLRVTTASDVSPTSTGHGFQVGPDSGQNIGMDGNEIAARNGGVPSSIGINYDGGNVTLGDEDSTVLIPGRIAATHAPWGEAAGSASVSGSGTTTVSFPGGRFTKSPIVSMQVIGSGGQVAVAYMDTAPSTSSFKVRIFNLDGTQLSGTVHWQAIQMSASSAVG